uniref:Uncharacterized protein n=1 Tax=Timema bartmani TaxID=61472 RepID=A0A7R9HWX6_9NEOP|nr:unnamed protein product [Timema bartmani]
MGSRLPESILVIDRCSTTQILLLRKLDLEVVDLQSLEENMVRNVKQKVQSLTSPQDVNSTMPSVAKSNEPDRDATPCAKDFEEASPSGCSLVKKSNHVSPKDIWPIPQPKGKMTNKGPKSMMAAKITSSPYKLSLEESEKRKAEKQRKKKGKKQKFVKGDELPSVKQQDQRKNKSKKYIKRKLIFLAEESDEEFNIDSEKSLPEIEIGVPRPDNDDDVKVFFQQTLWVHNECAGSQKDGEALLAPLCTLALILFHSKSVIWHEVVEHPQLFSVVYILRMIAPNHPLEHLVFYTQPQGKFIDLLLHHRSVYWHVLRSMLAEPLQHSLLQIRVRRTLQIIGLYIVAFLLHYIHNFFSHFENREKCRLRNAMSPRNLHLCNLLLIHFLDYLLLLHERQEGPLSTHFVVAGPYQDHLCLAVAKQLQKTFGGWVPPFPV